MMRSILKRVRVALAGLTGKAMARPMNLLVTPRSLEPDPDGCIVIIGRDVTEVLAGCGGLLAKNISAGRGCMAIVRSPLTEMDLNALVELGMRPDTVFQFEKINSSRIPAGAVLFYPFPPVSEEKRIIDDVERKMHPESYFYESRLLVLPEYRVRIDDGLGAKLRALSSLGLDTEPGSSHAAAVYGSAATGQGVGWYESFISFERGIEALSSREGS